MALSVGTLAVACSSGDDEGGGGGGGGGGGLDGGGPAIGEWLEALPLPDDVGADQPLVVHYGDLAQAAALAEDVLPAESPEGLTDDEQLRLIMAMTGGPLSRDGSSPVAVTPPEASHVDRMGEIDAFADEVGWDVFDVHEYIELMAQPSVITVMDGDFDGDAMTEAMGEPEDGVWQLGNENGDLDLEDTSTARPLGEPLWLRLDDERLTIARTAGDMAAAVGDEPSETVADDPVMVALADGLSGAGVYSAMLYSGGMPADPGRATPQQAEQACEQALPEAFGGVAAGIADDDGPVVVLVFAHTDEGAADANAEALRSLVEEGDSLTTQEPWSDVLSVDEVGAEGNLTVARLRPVEDGRAAIWRQLLVQRDNLVTYC